jgi:hypothetical protein
MNPQYYTIRDSREACLTIESTFSIGVDWQAYLFSTVHSFGRFFGRSFGLLGLRTIGQLGHLDNLNQNFGWPIKPAKCEVVLTAGGRGKWCKILHSGHILPSNKQTISLKENINYVPTDVYTQGWRIYMYFNPNVCQMWNVLNLIM